MIADDEFHAAAAELTAAAAADALLARFDSAPLGDRLRAYREIRRLARGYRREGLGPEATVARIARHMAKDPELRSILAIIGLAAIAATVRFFVTRLWRRWFPD